VIEAFLLERFTEGIGTPISQAPIVKPPGVMLK
jgi:hypothetical protein